MNGRIGKVVRAHGGDHVDALRKIVDLYFEGTVREVGQVQDSIPVVAEAFVHASVPPPREGINTIPGPGGAPSRSVAVPSAPSVPALSSTSVTAPEREAASKSASPIVSSPDSPSMAAVPASLPSDHATTPVSLPSPKLESTDISDDETTTPSGRSAPPPDTKKGWKPAPPPGGSFRPRQQTPKGFQRASPDGRLLAGGTILNWSGRLPNPKRSDEGSDRETVQEGDWDDTLSELRDDPEVDDAIEAIDSNPPPGPFVRSTPPSDRPVDPGVEAAEHPVVTAASQSPELPEVEPPARTYERVFEAEEGVSVRAPRAVESTSLVVAAKRRPSVLPWALLLLAVVFGTGAVAFVVSQRREPAPQSAAVPGPAPAPTSAPASEPAPASAPAPEPAAGLAPAATSALRSDAASASKAPALEDDPGPLDAEQLGPPVEDPAVIYPPTGAPDTYEAQIELARRLKRGSRAVAAYRRAIALNPEGADALAELGRLMLERRHTREASELAERATAIEPRNSLAWVTLGAARQMRGDRQGARHAYQNCVKLGRGRYVSECRAMLR